jgi:hypothetical protein
MVVMMGILSVVLTLVGKTMVLTMRSERKGRNAIVSANGLTRLANRFRRDVHAAENAELVGDGDAKLLRLTGVDGTIVEYRPEAGGVKLTVRRDQKQTARESYRLQGATRFEITANPRTVVTLIHVPDHGRIAGSNAAAKSDKQIRVEASAATTCVFNQVRSDRLQPVPAGGSVNNQRPAEVGDYEPTG